MTPPLSLNRQIKGELQLSSLRYCMKQRSSDNSTTHGIIPASITYISRYCARNIILILDQLLTDGYITSKQHKFLSPQSYNISSRYFYILPKVHKPISSWPQPSCPPGRPIISDVNTEFSTICSYIDH